MTNLFASGSMGDLQISTSYYKNNNYFKMLVYITCTISDNKMHFKNKG